MKRLTLAIANVNVAPQAQELAAWPAHPLVERILWLRQPTAPPAPAGTQELITDSYFSGPLINKLLALCRTDYLLLLLPGGAVELGARALERLVQVADDTEAGLLYSDYRERQGVEISEHPLIDYQTGSLRDNFDFGALLLLSRQAAQVSLQEYGAVPDSVRWGGLYDLRLKLSTDFDVVRVPEPLYTRAAVDTRASGEKLFDYVDPRQREYQLEMERLATEHLQRINAWLAPEFVAVPEADEAFPVKASIIIPVRNRAKTIAEAMRSALTQQADFDFNVIVVDNHSTDGTTELLRAQAADNGSLIHLIPTHTDLGIGGCWNEALYAAHCGRYAVQLDSDDIYAGADTLARIVAEFERGPYAMVIGSYTIVDFDLNELPPGLIDHREWTRANGRNNALRINGLGAPRAFDVSVLRQIGLPNVSYGEDYAVALRLSRTYEIGRIYDSLYFARRWSGNSDSALPLATANRYDSYKDHLRTVEIEARRQFNAKAGLRQT
ncbi:MAG: glycosyltransferase family 2 protein [Acidobacteria bacterium]|nr:glycosyltransferase family 2 protein [Acidobacteriota bacterium]MBI3427562.1 glycosyltransferase family 2 protein [Acidobacteriota bacterium]